MGYGPFWVTMTDSDLNYVKNAQLKKFFNGQTVPGDNSISEEDNLARKNSIDLILNSATALSTYTPSDPSTNRTDINNLLNQAALILYKMDMDGENITFMSLPRDLRKKLKIKFVGVPYAGYNSKTNERGETA